MHWEFDEDGNDNLATPEELGGDTMTIRQSGDNKAVEITHKDCNTAHRILGKMINPAGTQTAAAEQLLEKVKKIAAEVQADYLPRHYAQVVCGNIYLPGIGYSLPVTTFSEDELNHIQSTPIQAILTSMGYNRNIPKAVVFGPREYGGIGLRHLYIEQGSQQTATFMRHYRHDGRIGRALLRIELQWF
jgi:hypothetical protein